MFWRQASATPNRPRVIGPDALFSAKFIVVYRKTLKLEEVDMGNEAGKMTDLVVMLRLADVVAKLGEEAARRMAAMKSRTLTWEMSTWQN